jgi:putative transposase
MQGNLSVDRMCRLVGVSRAGFYRSLKGREPDLEEMELKSAIQSVAVEHKRRYGYRRISLCTIWSPTLPGAMRRC